MEDDAGRYSRRLYFELVVLEWLSLTPKDSIAHHCVPENCRKDKGHTPKYKQEAFCSGCRVPDAELIRHYIRVEAIRNTLEAQHKHKYR